MCLSNVSQEYKTAVSSEVPNSSTQTPPAKIPGYYQGPTVQKKSNEKMREGIPPWMSTIIKGKVKTRQVCLCQNVNWISSSNSVRTIMRWQNLNLKLNAFLCLTPPWYQDFSFIGFFRQFPPLSRTLCLTDHLALSHWSKYWPQTGVTWERWVTQSINTIK